MKFFKEHTFFCLLFISSFALRIFPLFNYQFTYDEISALERTQFNSFTELIHKGIQVDAHPALIQTFLFYWVKLFGFTEWIIKLPFILFSLLSICFGYFLGLKNFSKQVGNLLASFLSFSLIFVYQAPIARMYSIGVCFSLALLFYFFEIVNQKNKAFKNYFLLALFALLSALNHHMNALFAFTVLFFGIFLLEKKQIRNYFVMCLSCIVFYFPHLSITLHQLSLGGIGANQQGWLDAPQWNAFFTFMKVLFGTGYLFIISCSFLFIHFLINKKNSLTKIQFFQFFIFIINYLIIYFYSIFKAPILQNSVLLFSGTAFLIFVCTLLDSSKKHLAQFTLGLITGLLFYQTYFNKNYFTECVQSNFEFEFEKAKALKVNYGEQNVAAIFLDADPIMKQIYFQKFGKLSGVISTDTISKSLKLFSEFLQNSKANYLVLGAGTPIYHALAREYFPYLLEQTERLNVFTSVYSKIQGSKVQGSNASTVLNTSNLFQKGNFEYPQENFCEKNNSAFQLKIDSTNEFPFSAKAKFKQVILKQGNILLVKTKFKMKSNVDEIQTVISVDENSANKNLSYSGNSSRNFIFQNDSTITVYAEYFAGLSYTLASDSTFISAYIWNNKKVNCSLIDFQITSINFWKTRWSFWE